MPARDVAGVILLDPPTGAGDVVRTAKTRVLWPAQASKIDTAAKEPENHKFEAWSWSMVSPVVLVVPEVQDGLDKCSEQLPGAEVRLVDGAQAGGLLRFSSVSSPFVRFCVP